MLNRSLFEQKIIDAMAAQLISNREVMLLKSVRALLAINDIDFSGSIVFGEKTVTAAQEVNPVALRLIDQVEGGVNLALSTILAIKLNLFSLVGTFNMTRQNSYYEDGRQNACYWFLTNFCSGFDAKVELKAVASSGQYLVAEVHSSKTQINMIPDGWRSIMNWPYFETRGESHRRTYAENTLTPLQLLTSQSEFFGQYPGAGNFHTGRFHVPTKSHQTGAINLNENNYAGALAEKIFLAIKENTLEEHVGQELATKCRAIYEAANQSVIESEDVLSQAQALARFGMHAVEVQGAAAQPQTPDIAAALFTPR